MTRAGHARGDVKLRHVALITTAPRRRRRPARCATPSATTTWAPSQTLSPTSMPRAVRPWSRTGTSTRSYEMIAADEIRIRGDEHLLADPDRRRRKDFDVEADVGVFVERRCRRSCSSGSYCGQ